MENLPTLREELDRKTKETVAKLVFELKTGRITKSEFFTGIETVWDVTAGLVDEGVNRAVSQVLEKTPSLKLDRHFFVSVNSGEVVLVERDLFNFDLQVKSQLTHSGDFTKVHSFNFDAESNPAIASKSKLEAVIERLRSRGFKPL